MDTFGRLLVRLFLAAMLISLGVAAEKHNGWQTGIVLDPQQSHYFTANSPETQTNGGTWPS
jgi:hypothetical protein